MNLPRLFALILIAMLAAGAATDTAHAGDDQPIQVDLSYDKFTLDNGLTVLVHTDRSTPTVFIGLWYGVGSKDEPEGRTGFAHLFEHLMFQGTANREGEYFSPLSDAGATGMNGTTAEDRTNYFATVPTGALDLGLWMESDRMIYLMGAVTQEALDEQRGVVQNEKRQRENAPFAPAFQRTREAIYPVGHPYRHNVIGSMEDLDAARLEDVRDWFETYYGASNAVLVLSGDVDLDTAKEKVARYFGEAPAGKPLAKSIDWPATLSETRRDVMHDNVGEARISRTWILPGQTDKDAFLAMVVARTLAGHDNSPLRRRLVDELKLATHVSASVVSRQLGSEFHLTVRPRPGVDHDEVLAEVDAVLAQYLEDGPDKKLVESIKLQSSVSLLGAAESPGAIGVMLARGELYADDPLFINRQLAWLENTTADEARAIANRWLTQHYFELTVLPFPKYKAGETVADRSQLPSVGAVSSIKFPEVRETTLANGMKLVVAERGAAPLVEVHIDFATGLTAASSDAPNVPELTFRLLDKGTRRYTAREITAAKDDIGMQGGAAAGAEFSSYRFRILRRHLDEALGLARESIGNASFPAEEVEKFAAQRRARLATDERAPAGNATALLKRAVYGDRNVLGAVVSPADYEALDRQLLVDFHRNEIAPDNATIFVVGAIDFDSARAAVEKAFGKWRSEARSQRAAVGRAEGQAGRVILVDYPGATSSTIVAGHAIAPFDADATTALGIMNTVIGGGFESRLNLNLREDKAWSYGYRSGIRDNVSGDQLFMTSGKVQVDKTMESMIEIRKEIAAFVADRPPTATEVDRVKQKLARSQPGSFRTNDRFLYSMLKSSWLGLPYDYAEGDVQRIEAVTTEQVTALARETLDPAQLTWVVIGDLATIEDKVRSLDFGPVEVWNAFGQRLR